jgi:hypothetical protein
LLVHQPLHTNHQKTTMKHPQHFLLPTRSAHQGLCALALSQGID